MLYKLNYYGTGPTLSAEDQFYMTLVKLLHVRPYLGRTMTWTMFLITEKKVLDIFITWMTLYFQLRDLDWWPSRDLVTFSHSGEVLKNLPQGLCGVWLNKGQLIHII